MIQSGLVQLRKNVAAYFATVGVTANVSLGWKQPTKQINQGTGRANRVVIIPADGANGGSLVGVQQPGQRRFGTGDDEISARALYTWERAVIVSCWAVDLTDPHDEELQIEAVEDLFERTIQAVHYSAYNDARWGKVAWMTNATEQVFGRELRAALTFRHPMFDVEYGLSAPAPLITKDLKP